MNGLYVDSVLKAYGNKQVLTDVFLECKQGEVVGLLGRNGSGKSTLLKIIFGSLRADQKFIKIGKKRIRNLRDRKGLISYLHQNNFIPGHVRVRTILSLLSDRDAIKELISKPFIAKILNQKGSELSAGEKRLVEIFLAVFSNSEYVLLDEPFNGVSPIHIDDIKAAIKEQSQYKGFILTDHDYRNIVDISTRLILLHDGGTREVREMNDLVKWNYVPEHINPD